MCTAHCEARRAQSERRYVVAQASADTFGLQMRVRLKEEENGNGYPG